jgi:DNA-binding NarL/FixJ family response regulator
MVLFDIFETREAKRYMQRHAMEGSYMKKIRVIIADDQTMMREGLSLLLNSQPDIEVVGELFDRDKIEESVQRLRPEVLLLDSSLLQHYGIRSITALHKSSPETKIIMLSDQNQGDGVHSALKSGARGFIVKQAASSEVAEAIRLVINGHYYLSPIVLNRVIETYLEGTRTKPRGRRNEHNKFAGFNQLSEREKEIFQLLLTGLSSREISVHLKISSKTVDKHRASIFRKTGVENSTQLLHYAIRLGLIDEKRAI